MATDPLDTLGAPATVAAPATDPLASLGVPAVPPESQSPGLGSKILEGAKQSQIGQAVTGAANVIAGPKTPTEQVIHSVGGVPGLASYRAAKALVTAADGMIKSAAEEYPQAVSDFQRTVSDFHNKDWRNMASSAVSTAADAAGIVAPETVAGAQGIRELSEGARPGGNLATPVTRDAIDAATLGLGVKAGEAPDPNAVPVKVTPKNPWASARTIIRNATRSPEAEGAAVEQPLAQAGIKANAPTVGASFRSGIDVDTPFKEAKTLYKAVDDATGTKFQDLYEKLDAAKDAERVAASGSPEEARASATVKTQEDFINDMRERAKSAGVNVDRTLAAADKKFAEAQANKEFNNKFFGNQGILKGNATQGAPETVNVQKAIDTLESMDKPNKYGLSRLQQTSLGKNGVAALKQSLYDAQKAGQAAMDARQFRNTILKFAGIGGGALAGTYELTK